MDILEQPLEAVAFRIYSLPEAAAAGSAAWTCLAAVLAAAAAAGLWHLRSSAPHGVTDAAKSLEIEPSQEQVSPEPEIWSERPSESSTSSSPRERYTAYYYDSGCVGCCDVEGDEVEEDQVLEDDDGVYGPSEADPLEWEVVRPLHDLRATTTAAAETGRYRNATALRGSVVRLWDQGLTAAASPRRRGRVGTISAF